MIRTDAPDLTAIARALRADAPELLPELRKEMKSTVAGAVASAKSAPWPSAWTAPPAHLVADQRPRPRQRQIHAVPGRGRRDREAAGVRAALHAAGGAAHPARRPGPRYRLGDDHQQGRDAARRPRRRAAAFLTSRSSTRSFRNYGKWRHPIIHPRRLPRSKWTWVEQRLVDPMWWDDSIAPHAEKAQADAEQALDRWTQQVAALIDSKR